MKEILKEFLEQSQYWGFVFSVGAYLSACWLKENKACSFKSASGVSGCYHCFSFGNRRGLCGLQSKCIRFGLASNTGHGVPGDPSL